MHACTNRGFIQGMIDLNSTFNGDDPRLQQVAKGYLYDLHIFHDLKREHILFGV